MELEQLAYIGRQLRFARERKKLSQLQVASQLKLSQNFYSKWENGQHPFSFIQICEVAQILDIKLENLDPMFLKCAELHSGYKVENLEPELAEEGMQRRYYEGLIIKKNRVINELNSRLKNLLQRELPYGL